MFANSYIISAALIGTAIVISQTQIAVPQTANEQALGSIAKEITVVINGQNPGSGVIISKQGNTYSVLTAKHVVATPDEYTIITSEGTKHPLDYRTVKKLPGVDLAVVQFTSNKNYRVAVLGNSEAVKEGATIYISGWPHPGPILTDRIYQITKGTMSGRPLQALQDGYGLVYTNITRSGMSGGPVLDSEGRLIGIHGRADGEPIFNPETGQTVNVKSGFNLGIPINSFLQLADQAGVNLSYSSASFSLFKTIKTTGILALAVSPDGQTFVAGDEKGEVQLWNLQTGELKKSLGKHSDSVIKVLISPDGQTLVSGSDDQTIKIWNLRSGQLKTTLSGIPEAISPDGQTLAGYSKEKEKKGIELWNLSTGQLIKTINIQRIRPIFAFSPNGQIAIAGNVEGWAMEIWDLRADKPLRTLKFDREYKPGGILQCVSVSPDGQTLVTEWYGGRPRLWNLETGEFIRSLSDVPQGYNAHACLSKTFDPNGQIYVSASRHAATRTAYFWNLQTGRRFELPNSNAPVAFSPDGQTIIAAEHLVGSSFHHLKIWRSPAR